jgi:hypothetical protein
MFNFINSAFLLVIIFLTLLLPGRVISDLIIGPIKDHNNMISIIFGFCFFLLASIFFYLFEWKLINLNIIILTTSTLSLIILVKKYISNFDFQKFISLDTFQIIVLVLFLFLFYMHSNILMISSENLGSDYWYYAAQSNYFVETGRLSLQFPYFDAPNSMYPFSFLFTIVALLEINTGWSALKIINHLGSVFIISVVYCNYILIEHFIKNKLISIISIFLMLMLTFFYKEGIFYIFLSYPFYPKLVSIFLFFPVFIYILLNKKSLGDNHLILVAAVIIPFINFHPQNSLWLMIYLLAYALFEIIKSRTINLNLIYLLLLGVVIISVNFLLIFNSMYSESAAFFQYSPEDTNDYFLNLMGLRIVNPMIYFHGRTLLDNGISLPSLNLVAIFALFGLIIIKRNYLLLYSFILLACISLIIFNPFIVEIFLKVMPYFIFERFIYLIPTIFIFGYLFALILDYCLGIYNNFFNTNRKLKKFIELLSIIIFIYYLLITMLSIDKYSSKISNDSAIFFNFLENNIETDSFILTDGITAFKLSAFKKIRVPYINEGFLSSYIDPKDKKNITLLFSEKVQLDKKISIINSYNFNYIVINKNMKNNDFLKLGVEGYYEIFDNNEFQVLSKK